MGWGNLAVEPSESVADREAKAGGRGRRPFLQTAFRASRCNVRRQGGGTVEDDSRTAGRWAGVLDRIPVETFMECSAEW